MKRSFMILFFLLLTGAVVWLGGFLSYTPWAADFSPSMEYAYEAMVGLLAGLGAGYALRRQLPPSKSVGNGLRWMAAAMMFMGILPFLPFPAFLQLGNLFRYRILLFGFAGLFLGESF